jgi:hypothetical protein
MISAISVPGSSQSVKLEDQLSSGTWAFQVKTVDSDGEASAFSEPVTMTFQ